MPWSQSSRFIKIKLYQLIYQHIIFIEIWFIWALHWFMYPFCYCWIELYIVDSSYLIFKIGTFVVSCNKT